MVSRPDADGRYPLSGREWAAYRCLIVAVNELDVCANELRGRLKLIPGGWRDLRMLSTVSYKLFNALAETIPQKKLLAIQEEIHNSQIQLVVRSPLHTMPPSVVYIDEKAFIAVMDRLINTECWCCEKTGKDVKRCEIKKLIMDVLHYDTDPSQAPADGRCELAGHTSILIDEEGGK